MIIAQTLSRTKATKAAKRKKNPRPRVQMSVRITQILKAENAEMN